MFHYNPEQPWWYINNLRDRKLTLSQNYERLGLSVRLNAATGGTEKKIKARSTKDPLAIKSGSKAQQITPGEVRVERDPETGKILRIIRPEQQSRRPNPLNDPLNDIMDTDDEEELESNDEDDSGSESESEQNPIVAELEAQAAREMEEIEQKKKPRQQSTREEEWIERLIEKHGDDTGAMFRDRKLNVMQQSEGDIKKRIKKWKKKHEAST